MSAAPRISIAMATYNGARYIREQLDSLAAQTLQPCELVVTDDGSTDRTIEIIQLFSETSPFKVRILKNESRLGYPDNFLRAASLCEGDLIAFCDQDDIWLSDNLLIRTKQFENADVVLCACDGHIVDSNLKNYGFTIMSRQHLPCRKYPITTFPAFANIPGLTQMFRKSILDLFDHALRCEDLGKMSGASAHDQWITFLSSVTGSISIMPESLVLYRQHGQNVSGHHGAKLTFGARLSRFMSYSAEQSTQRLIVCKQRHNIINAIKKSDAKYGGNLKISAHFYDELLAIAGTHAQFYKKDTTQTRRVWLLLTLIANNYCSRSRMGWRTPLKDMLFILLVPFLIDRTC